MGPPHPLPGAQQVASFDYSNPARQQVPGGGVYEGRIPQLPGPQPGQATPYNGLAALLAKAAQRGTKLPGGYYQA